MYIYRLYICTEYVYRPILYIGLYSLSHVSVYATKTLQNTRKFDRVSCITTAHRPSVKCCLAQQRLLRCRFQCARSLLLLAYISV